MLRILVLGTLLAACGPPKKPPGPPAPKDDLPPLGTVAGKVTLGEALAVHLIGRAVPLAELPMADLIGMPMSGPSDFAIDIDVPAAPGGKGARDYSKATGTAAFSCTACRLGKEGTKILEGSPLARGGVAVGHIELDRIEARAEIGGGRARVVVWKLESKEVALEITLELELKPALAEVGVNGCVRYKVLPPLQKRDPKITALIDLIGGQPNSDGMSSVVMSGKLSNVRLAAGACTTKR
jgi:hypothetical protein